MEQKKLEIEQLQNQLGMANQKIISKQDEIDNLTGEKWKFENKAKELEYSLNQQDEIYENLKRKQDQQQQELAESLAEKTSLKEQLAFQKSEQLKFYEKYCETNEELLKLKQQHNVMARYNEQIEEIHKNRDERINAMRDEIQQALICKDEIEAKYQSLVAENQTNVQFLEKEKARNKETTKKMDQLYSERNILLTENQNLTDEKNRLQALNFSKDQKLAEAEKQKQKLNKEADKMA